MTFSNGKIVQEREVKCDKNFTTFVRMEIQIINGPNINLLGRRENNIYGKETFDSFLSTLRKKLPNISITHFQSNIEGEVVDKLHEVGFSCRGIVLNGGAYTHTSIAIHDAIAAITTDVVEVHISNLYAREDFRHKSIISSKCVGFISGFGLAGYAMAVQYFVRDFVQTQ